MGAQVPEEQGEVLSEPPQAVLDWGEESLEVPQVQRALTKALDGQNRDRLLSNLPPEDRAWVRSCGGPSAGAWLNTAPTTEVEKF